MSIDNEKVWYASYGSNLLTQRMACYIEGGKPIGSQHVHSGCRDNTLPEKSESIIINHKLYFANNAQGWDGHGVGFISNQYDSSIRTYGRKHLITKEQFIDLVKQENKNYEDFELDFEETIRKGSLIIRDTNWYGRMLYLGDHDGFPIFSFTAVQDLLDRLNKPNHAYLKTIIEGIKEIYPLTDQEIHDYLMPLSGINGEFHTEELLSLIKQEFPIS